MAIIFVTALTVVLTGADGLTLSSDQTSSWILVLYGLPAVASLVLTVRYRQPLLLTGNIFAIIFVASLAEDFRYEELAGAFLLAGVGVLMAAAFGLTGHLARWVPTPIVFGLTTILLRSHDFQPPERLIDIVSGAGTIAGSFIGPLAVSIAVPLVPLAAGPAAGPQHLRYRSVYVAALVMLLIAISADTGPFDTEDAIVVTAQLEGDSMTPAAVVLVSPPVEPPGGEPTR